MYIYIMQCTCVLHPLGTKYRYAKQWGIHCVSAQWFHDSVEAGYSMLEVDYDVDREQGGEAGEKEDGDEGETARGTGRKRYVCSVDNDKWIPSFIAMCIVIPKVHCTPFSIMNRVLCMCEV